MVIYVSTDGDNPQEFILAVAYSAIVFIHIQLVQRLSP